MTGVGTILKLLELLFFLHLGHLSGFCPKKLTVIHAYTYTLPCKVLTSTSGAI